MEISQNEVIRCYLKSLQMELLIASYSDRVALDWGRPLREDGYHRLYVILGGEGWIQVDTQKVYPTHGQLVFLPAQTPLTYGTVNTNTFRKYWCHFSAKVGSFHLSQLIHMPICIDVPDMPYLKRLFERLVQSNQTRGDMTAPLKTSGILSEIVSYYMDNCPPTTVCLSSSPATHRSNQILQYIEEHLSESLTPKRLSDAFHYNSNYFSRYFKSLFHISPSDYINKVRVERAQWLLTHTNLTVEEIANKVGLERFYFANLFKRMTALPPGEYRAMHHAQAQNISETNS
ncbi:HTH-type transcriptional regulator YesS [compost metagenome]